MPSSEIRFDVVSCADVSVLHDAVASALSDRVDRRELMHPSSGKLKIQFDDAAPVITSAYVVKDRLSKEVSLHMSWRGSRFCRAEYTALVKHFLHGVRCARVYVREFSGADGEGAKEYVF